MNVTDLTLANAKFRAAETMWMRFDSIPGEQGIDNLFGCAANGH
jgi:hypothetical protein